MRLSVRLHPGAERKLKRLAKRDRDTYRRLGRALRKFVKTGRGIEPVRPPLFRLRAGDWRIFIGVKGEKALIVDLLWRDAAYRLEVVERLLKRARLADTL